MLHQLNTAYALCTRFGGVQSGPVLSLFSTSSKTKRRSGAAFPTRTQEYQTVCLCTNSCASQLLAYQKKRTANVTLAHLANDLAQTTTVLTLAVSCSICIPHHAPGANRQNQKPTHFWYTLPGRNPCETKIGLRNPVLTHSHKAVDATGGRSSPRPNTPPTSRADRPFHPQPVYCSPTACYATFARRTALVCILRLGTAPPQQTSDTHSFQGSLRPDSAVQLNTRACLILTSSQICLQAGSTMDSW